MRTITRRSPADITPTAKRIALSARRRQEPRVPQTCSGRRVPQAGERGCEQVGWRFDKCAQKPFAACNPGADYWRLWMGKSIMTRPHYDIFRSR
jgi:hypothetical protein